MKNLLLNLVLILELLVILAAGAFLVYAGLMLYIVTAALN